MTCYGLIGVWALLVYFVGPATPLISEEMGISTTEAGLTGTALALGLVLSGVVGPRLVGLFGRRGALLVTLAVLLAGAGVLTVIPGFLGVLAAIAVCTVAGAVIANTASAILSDRHGPRGAVALTEANAVAAWVGLASPAVLGAAAGIGWGWRPAALVIAFAAGGMLLVTPRTTRKEMAARHPAHPHSLPTEVAQGDAEGVDGRGMPRVFYVCLVAVAAAVATEFSVNFWGALLVSQRTGADLPTTTACMSVLIGGIGLGRTLGSRIVARSPPVGLVVRAFGLAALGLLLVMASPILQLSVVGLLITGLGISLLFPLTQSLAIAHSRGKAVEAAAAVAVAIGVSLGVAPFVLGALSSMVGVVAAFGMVPVVMITGVVAVRAVRHHPPGWDAPSPNPGTERSGRDNV